MLSCHGCTPTNCPYYRECTHLNPKVMQVERDHTHGPELPEEKPNSTGWPEWPEDSEL